MYMVFTCYSSTVLTLPNHMNGNESTLPAGPHMPGGCDVMAALINDLIASLVCSLVFRKSYVLKEKTRPEPSGTRTTWTRKRYLLVSTLGLLTPHRYLEKVLPPWIDDFQWIHSLFGCDSFLF